MNNEVRVRFAPSPTGPLHIGGVRTALYNYLFAKKNNGRFILRIEDTDRTRYVDGAEKYIKESLKWLSLDYDEGPDKDGDSGPYRQSERIGIYRQYADMLVERGNAYYAFDSDEELDSKRKEYEQKGETFKYDALSRISMRNALTMEAKEVSAILQEGDNYVIRIKMPEKLEIKVNDVIRGEVAFSSSELDDKVLFKSDGYPTYHLANVVDDYMMRITHVIRGEEWLPSAPLHVLLYDFLGWKDSMPAFAHIPLIMKSSGKGKLSKRDGDTGGFPVFPLDWHDPSSGDIYSGYREAGYFPEALINILAFLGWNPGTEKELYSVDELIEDFSLERIGKSGARFDPDKAKWFNHQYMIRRSEEQLLPLLKEYAANEAEKYDDDVLKHIIALVKERAVFPINIWEQSFYFFHAPQQYDQKMLEKKWKEDIKKQIAIVNDMLKGIENFKAAEIEMIVKGYISEQGLNMGDIMGCLRLCLVGSPQGVHLFDIFEIIGKEESILRIDNALRDLP